VLLEPRDVTRRRLLATAVHDVGYDLGTEPAERSVAWRRREGLAP
jgi:hypothetical protein